MPLTCQRPTCGKHTRTSPEWEFSGWTIILQPVRKPPLFDTRCTTFLPHLYNESKYQVRLVFYTYRKRPSFNPLTLRVAKTGLTIWEIFYLWKHFLEIIWRRNVDQKLINKQQLSFKYFANLRFIPMLFPKVWKKQTILSRVTLSVNGLTKSCILPFKHVPVAELLYVNFV